MGRSFVAYRPVGGLAVVLAPHSTACAAARASTVSVLPWRRRAAQSGRLTSTTVRC